MKKLSIVIPVYNTYPYLRECLDSIINQTYKNLEIIVVNDASPYEEDDRICKEYAEKDNRIVYIKHAENKFQGGARNTGIEAATGEYITFVDSDDYILEKYAYERLMKYAEDNKVDVILFGIYIFIDGKDNIKKQVYKNSYYKKAKKVNSDYFPSEVVWNKIFLSESIKSNNIKFLEKIKYEDIEFWYRYVITVNPVIKYIDENYYMYRQWEHSVMSTSSNFIRRFDVYKIIYNFIKANNKEKEYRKNIIKWLNYPEQYEYFTDEIKDIYRQHTIEFMEEINVTADEIFKILDMRVFKLFFSDKFIADKYSAVIENYKPVKYKYTKVNIFFYKLKRETKRIVNKVFNNIL